jgi:hypothetical protein
MKCFTGIALALEPADIILQNLSDIKTFVLNWGGLKKDPQMFDIELHLIETLCVTDVW